MLTHALAARWCQSSSPFSGLLPQVWLLKSTTVVAPPKAAALVPVPKVSTVRDAEVPVQMGVHVDAAGDHQKTVGVVDLDLVADLDVAADCVHPAVLDQHVRLVVVDGGDETAVLDQYGCQFPLLFSRHPHGM